jgi:uncharacterized protein (DUF885 family)
MTRVYRLTVIAFLLLGAGVARAHATGSAAAPADSAYEAVAASVLQAYYQHNPTRATGLGLHEYDGRLEDYSRAGLESELAGLRRLREHLRAIDPGGLTLANRLDREFLLHVIDAQLLRGESVRALERDPDVYSSGLTNSAYSLIKRDYAPAAQRLRSLIERERSMPAVLQESRRNLENPPRIYTEIAIEQLDGNQNFFRTALVDAFAGVDDAALKTQFKRTNDAVIAALGAYKTWLQQDLLPRSHGDFALGADLYRRLLEADEMIDTPLDQLLAIAAADLAKNQADFKATARRIDASKPPLEVLASLQADHPAPDRLLAVTQAELDSLGRFMTERHIVTIPAAQPARVQETPPFMRATTSASMDTPGPFERGHLNGFYSMTLPDPAWSAEETEDFMRQWFYPLISNVSVHEVWPGHYLQFLYAKNFPSDVRKVFRAASNSEGWAHYCEQMVIDEGFHADDPRYRLAQLQDALLRDARFIVGIRMHTQGMSFDQAVAFFEQDGYQPRPVAISETKRGTSDATYGYYTMGKLAILKLRDDYRANQGTAYSLQKFHDAFIALGPLPLPLVREALLGERGALY